MGIMSFIKELKEEFSTVYEEANADYNKEQRHPSTITEREAVAIASITDPSLSQKYERMVVASEDIKSRAMSNFDELLANGTKAPKYIINEHEEPLVGEFDNLTADDFIKMVHDEIDGLYLKTINEHEDLLKTLNIIPASHVEDKGAKLKKLGFSNKIEGVRLYEALETQNKQIQKRADEIKAEVDKMLSYGRYYDEKILRMSDFVKVLEKYSLIYADVKHYIKDIPELNVNEMFDAKETAVTQKPSKEIYISGIRYDYGIQGMNFPQEFMIAFTDEARKRGMLDRRTNTESLQYSLKSVLRSVFPDKYDELKKIVESRGSGMSHLTFSMGEADRSGMFIAAPKDHFDLKDLTGVSPYAMMELKPIPLLKDDPIAFKILDGDYVRIISKWGTSDDQSYLDPMLND